jgi:hypothetical protein
MPRNKDQLFRVPEMEEAMSRSNYETSFKEVRGGGFVFRPPNPWIFGSVQNYIANEEQKAEILELGRARYPILRTAILILALIGCPAGSILTVYLLSNHSGSGVLEGLAIAALMLSSYAVLLLTAVRWQLRRVRPVLAHLLPTDEQVTFFPDVAKEADRMAAVMRRRGL